MPWLLIIAGLMLVVSGWRGTQHDFYALVLGDFTGAQNFLLVFGAIVTLGAIGSIKTVKPIAGGLLVLLVLSMLISNKGFLAQLVAQVKSAAANPQFTRPTSADTQNTQANTPSINLEGGLQNILSGSVATKTSGSLTNTLQGGLTPIDVVVE